MRVARERVNARVDRRLSQIISWSALLLILGQGLREFDRGPGYSAWWILPTATVMLWILVWAVFGGVLPLRVLRLGWVYIPLAGFALQPLALAAYRGPAVDSVLPWSWTLTAVYVSYLSLSLPPAMAVVAALATGVLPALAGFLAVGRITTAAGHFVPVQMTAFAFVAVFIGIRSRWRQYLSAEAAFLFHEQQHRLVLTRGEEQRRVHRFVHDEVLSVLGAARRVVGPLPPALRVEAVRTLETIRAGVTCVDPPAPFTLAQLLAHAAELGFTSAVSADERAPRLPAHVADALYTAALEAMRNSARHAGPSRVRSLEISRAPRLVEISIVDHGAGFLLRNVPEDRLGVRQSILARVDELDGGAAHIASTPGSGTTVRLRWSPASPEPSRAFREYTETHPLPLLQPETGSLGMRWVRLALIAVLPFFAIHAILVDAVPAPFAWPNLIAYVAALTATILVTPPTHRVLSPRRVRVIMLLSILTTLSLSSYDSPSEQLWMLNYSACIPALLLIRNHLIAGLLAGASICSIGAAWVATFSSAAIAYVDVLTVPVIALATGSVWRYAFHRMSARESEHQAAALHTRFRRDLLNAQVAETHRAFAEVAARTTTALQQLAACHTIGPALRRRILATEASVRDFIRAPFLQHPTLSSSIARIRARGVEVVLLGESDAAASSGTISEALARAVSERIIELPTGARVHLSSPANAVGTALVLTVVDTGTTVRREFDRFGTLLSER